MLNLTSKTLNPILSQLPTLNFSRSQECKSFESQLPRHSGVEHQLRQPLSFRGSHFKQDKKPIFLQVLAQGHSVEHLLVTRRPQDFMFSHAAHAKFGFCQGFVGVILQKQQTFDFNLSAKTVAKQAVLAQQFLESLYLQGNLDDKGTFYQSMGYQCHRDSRRFSCPEQLIEYLKTTSEVEFADANQNKTLYFDLNFSGGHQTDHSAGIVLTVQDGQCQGAVIDADRGIRRTMDQPDFQSFFEDLAKQSSGDKTKNDHNRKFHAWRNRTIVLRQLIPADKTCSSP